MLVLTLDHSEYADSYTKVIAVSNSAAALKERAAEDNLMMASMLSEVAAPLVWSETGVTTAAVGYFDEDTYKIDIVEVVS